jgi:hypothetical protein
LLLAQPVLLVVLIQALLLPDPLFLHEGRPLPLPLLRSAADGLGSGRRRVRSGSLYGHQLRTGIVSSTEERETRTQKGRKTVLTG